MPVSIPTTDEIIQNRITDIESKLNQDTPLLDIAFTRVLATILAGEDRSHYEHVKWAYDQIFTASADEEALLRKGQSFGVAFKVATQAKLEATDTGTNGVIIRANTRYIGQNSLVYSVISDVEITGGVAVLELLCLTSGEEGNLQPGNELNIISTQIGVTGVAVVDSIIREGEDDEDIEFYRQRILDRERQQPQGGSNADYILWARDVAGVTRAFAFRTSPGYVTIYPLTDGDIGGRIPSQAKLDEVYDYVTDPGRKPLMAYVFVSAMTETGFDVEVDNLSPDTPELRTAIEDAIDAFIFSREPRQYEDQAETKDVISRVLLESIAVEAGARTLSIELSVTGIGTPIESYTLNYYELGLLNSITFI